MDKESLPPGDVEGSDEDAWKNGAGSAGKSGDKFPDVTPGAVSDKILAERRQSNRRTGERRIEERRTDSRREDADRRETERRFLTMEALEAAQSDAEIDSPVRREGGLWPSLDWRPGNQRMNQRRASERRIEDRRQEDRRKTDRRSRGRRASDHREDLYQGQVQLDENIDDLFEAGDYKGSAD